MAIYDDDFNVEAGTNFFGWWDSAENSISIIKEYKRQ
jgi:hypothetical protein